MSQKKRWWHVLISLLLVVNMISPGGYAAEPDISADSGMVHPAATEIDETEEENLREHELVVHAEWKQQPAVRTASFGPKLLRTKYGSFDPLVQEMPSSVPATAPTAKRTVSTLSSEAKNDRQQYLVQYTDEHDVQKLFEAFESAGILVLGYFPDQAYRVLASADQISRIKNLAFVRAAVELLPVYKVENRLADEINRQSHLSDSNKTVKVTLMMNNADQVSVVLERIRQTGGHILKYSAGDKSVAAELKLASLTGLAEMPEVNYIERYFPLRALMNTSRQILKSDTAISAYQTRKGLKLDGTGETVAVLDTGIDIGHQAFTGKIITSTIGATGQDPEAHGTHVAGIIAGSGFASTDLNKRGVATGVKLFDVPFLEELNLSVEEAVRTVWENKIRISNNSWGDHLFEYNEVDSPCSNPDLYITAADRIGRYSIDTKMLDDFVFDRTEWDQNALSFKNTYVHVQAAGNHCIINSPATAKNIITVGGTLNSSSSPDSLYRNFVDGSGIGPTIDERIKPDLLAPGQFIVSTLSGNADTGLYPPYMKNAYYTEMTGTSMAAPHVSAAAAISRQMFRTMGILPSAGLIKAHLINSSDKIATLTKDEQGFGRLNVDKMLNEPAWIYSDTRSVGPNTTQEFKVKVSTSERPLKVTLTWIEPGGDLSATSFTHSNLDLRLISPSGKVVSSTSRVDTVEQVSVSSPATGEWRIQVTGTEVRAIPGRMEQGQRFSLFGTGAAVVTADTIPPTAPTNLKITQNAFHDMELTWTPSTDNTAVSGYLIYEGTDTTPLEVVSGPKYTAHLLGFRNQSTYLRIRAKDANGNLSPEAVTNRFQLPSKNFMNYPQFISKKYVIFGDQRKGGIIVTSGEDIQLSYQLEDANLALIDQQVNDYSFNFRTAVMKTHLFVKDKHYFAYLDANNGISYVPNILEVRLNSAPDTPANLKVAGQSAKSLTITWNASADEDPAVSYLIYRNQSLEPVAVVNDTQFTDGDLQPGSAYTYEVVARDSYHLTSERSQKLTGSTLAATPVPTAVPTTVPTVKPTVAPTVIPTAVPTTVPTVKPTVAPTVVPTAVPTSGPMPYIDFENGGFESGQLASWTEWHPYGTPAAFGVDTFDVFSGKYKLYFWHQNPYKQSVHHVRQNMPAGMYEVSVMVKLNAYNGNPYVARLELDNFQDRPIFTNFAVNGVWTEYKSAIEVKNGKLDVGIYVDSPGRTSLQLDQVRFRQIGSGPVVTQPPVTPVPTITPVPTPVPTVTAVPTSIPTALPPTNKQVTIYYKNPNWSRSFIHYSLDGTKWTQVPGMPLTQAANGYSVITVQTADTGIARAAFNNGGSAWDNNNNKDFKLPVGVWTIENGIITPGQPAVQPPSASQMTVYYKASWPKVNIHFKTNGGSWTQAPGIAMTPVSDGYFMIRINTATATGIEACFNNEVQWDNNGGRNFILSGATVTVVNGTIRNGMP